MCVRGIVLSATSSTLTTKENHMATVTAKYLGDLRVECTHVACGTKLVSDAPVDNNGKGEAFSPTDLCVTALAS